jgi:hypothetical protein
MAYDRYDTRGGSRDEGSQWSGDRESAASRGRERGDWRSDSAGDRGNRGDGDQRGFFERAGDEIASWFGDDDPNRRHHSDDRHREERGWGSKRGSGGGMSRDRDQQRDRNWNDNRGAFASGGSSERDYNRGWQRELGGNRGGDWGRDDERSGNRGRDYRPMTGDYGRSEHESSQFFAASGVGRGDRNIGGFGRQDRNREDEWDRDPYRSTSRAGTSDRSDCSRHEDPHYSSWRDRHMSDLDRDYDDYRREHQSKFESDFGSWRERRQQKRGMMGQVREHMDVVGNDDEHVGTVDKVAGDRLILTKSDDASGGSHHSISCSDVGRVEGDRVILDCSADQARKRWRDEDRSRALFERPDQGEMGPRMLDRSFEGTYR